MNNLDDKIEKANENGIDLCLTCANVRYMCEYCINYQNYEVDSYKI